jgi:ubiquinone/menaquinone biosynthesis C-methylase UbiE
MFEQGQKIGCAFCTPVPKIRLSNGSTILEPITMEWHRHRCAISIPTNFNTIEYFADGMEVGEARTKIAYRCLEHDPRPEFLFFLDYDVLPAHDALLKLYARAQWNPSYDILAGVYVCKNHQPADPLIYAGNGTGPFWDWTLGDLLTTEGHGITACHMGLTLIRVSLFQRMLDAGTADSSTPFFKTVSESSTINGALKTRRGTEDIWFCALAQKLDPPAKILIDTSVLAGHIDRHTGITWGLPKDCPPIQRAHWLDSKKGENGQKIALDIGAGSVRRTWDGYRTYTTDIRPECKPDYVMDTRWLNLPDNHYDLVSSSHHLEHLGRWDQERVWKEMFRILKPGGIAEHIVPNVEWAAERIIAGEYDEHVANVLYGAQEAMGFERQYNVHYFGYTPAVARALAEQSGLVDVEIETYRERPELLYNMIVRGKKVCAQDGPVDETDRVP